MVLAVETAAYPIKVIRQCFNFYDTSVFPSSVRHENKHPGVYSTFLNKQWQSPHVSDEFHRSFLPPQTSFNNASSHLGRLLCFVFFFLFCFIRAKLPNASKKIKTSQIKNIKTLSDFVTNSYGDSIILWKITSPCSEPVSHSWKNNEQDILPNNLQIDRSLHAKSWRKVVELRNLFGPTTNTEKNLCALPNSFAPSTEWLWN